MSNAAGRDSRQFGRRDNARMFRAAARHSRFVRVLRLAIPAGIVAVAALLVIATFFNPFRLIAKFPIDPGKVALSGTRVIMDAPRLAGFTSDGRPYQLAAREAVQDVTKPGVLELSDLVAHVDQRDGQHVDIQSINGLYNTKSDLLTLHDHIVLVSTTGYEAYLSDATVTIKSGDIVSESPVSVKLPNGWLNSKRLEVVNNGALLRFGGGVEMTLNPESPGPAATDAIPPAPPAPAVAPASPAATKTPARAKLAAAPAKTAAVTVSQSVTSRRPATP